MRKRAERQVLQSSARHYQQSFIFPFSKQRIGDGAKQHLTQNLSSGLTFRVGLSDLRHLFRLWRIRPRLPRSQLRIESAGSGFDLGSRRQLPAKDTLRRYRPEPAALLSEREFQQDGLIVEQPLLNFRDCQRLGLRESSIARVGDSYLRL